MVNSSGIIILLVLIAIAVGLIFLQYKLCSAENGKKAGLILPIISFVISVICAVSVFLFAAAKTTSTSKTYDDDGNVIASEVIEEEADSSDVIPTIVGAFLCTNIPTTLFMIEYAILRSGKKKSELEAAEMAKTQIQDL
ncbi:MAG: hypothetical protein IJX77_04775 [Ruminococcus sp.]|nr:hypothetical protein [Ruminococcus sp.]